MKKTPLHPFFFVLYSILAPASINISEIIPIQLIRPIIIALSATVILLWMCTRFTRDKSRGALIASLIAVWFLYYGYFYRSIHFFPSLPDFLKKQWPILCIWSIAFGITAWVATSKYARLPRRMSYFLNITGAIMLIIPSITILGFFIRTPFPAYSYKFPINKTSVRTQSSVQPPDIYYIILDGYGREDVLHSLYEYNNTPFIESLRERGFFIANNSKSNYMQTSLSLNASLNLSYLDDLSWVMGSSNNRLPLVNELGNNLFARMLQEHGYKFFPIASAWNSAFLS